MGWRPRYGSACQARVPDQDLQGLGPDLVPAVPAAGACADLFVLLPPPEQPQGTGARDRRPDGADLPRGFPLRLTRLRLGRGALDRAALHSVAARVEACAQAVVGTMPASKGNQALTRCCFRIHCLSSSLQLAEELPFDQPGTHS